MMTIFLFFFFKQKTAYEMRISDWSSDVCSSDLYCTFNQDSDIESFMRAIEQGGVAAYKAMMESPRLPCYDARTQGIPPTGVELVRYIGDLTYTNGKDRKSVV